MGNDSPRSDRDLPQGDQYVPPHIIEEEAMSRKQVWFITGAGRGMGADFARAVLAAGHQLVATGRDPERVAKVLGPSGICSP